MTDCCMNLLKAAREVNQQEGGEEFKCYTIWQMMVAMLHSNRQLQTENMDKGCQACSTSDDAVTWLQQWIQA